jgi:hypothetical protein
MLAYPPDFNSQEDGNPEDREDLPKETSHYLTHIERKLYDDILNRKRIDAGLLFLACQISSCSLSWVLFQLQITLSVIQVFSACLSLLPGLIDVGDSFNFSINSESWEFSLGQKPLVGIVKLAIGGIATWQGTSKISLEVTETKKNINLTYQEIRDKEGLSFQLPMPEIGVSILIALVGIALIGIIKKSTGIQNNAEE